MDNKIQLLLLYLLLSKIADGGDVSVDTKLLLFCLFLQIFS